MTMLRRQTARTTLILLATLVILACGPSPADQPRSGPVVTEAGGGEGIPPTPYNLASIAQEDREQSLVSGWRFYRFPAGETFDSAQELKVTWTDVRLPHSARIEPRVVNDQWQGHALYQRSIFAKSQWQGKAIWLRFEGAMTTATLYLNDQPIYVHQGGYLPFTVDLSDKLKFGEDNELRVLLDNRNNGLTGPKRLSALDFNTYGGLYREVRLFVRHPLHITDEMLANRQAGGGVFVHFPEVGVAQATVAIKTHIANEDDTPRSFRISQTLVFEDESVAQTSSAEVLLAHGESIDVETNLVVPSPALWSPQSPNLHSLITRLHVNDQVLEQRETEVGIRQIEISRAGISINGRRQFLRGVNRHQEYPYVGYAISPNAEYRDALMIKEAGFDLVRLSHYPHSRHFMRAADKLGLVLIDAILGWQYSSRNDAFVEHSVQTCRDLIRRDRNHPSVVAWECSLNESRMSDYLVQQLHQAVEQEYPYPNAYSAGWVAETYDIFLEARQHRLGHPDRTIPAKPYIVSEYGDWEYYAQNAGLNQDAWEDLEEDARTSRQLLRHGETRLLQQVKNLQEAHNDNLSTVAIADGYWAMFDYNRGYADDLEASGLASLERIPKPSYHFFRSQRGPDAASKLFQAGPMVHIASAWTENSPTSVTVYSNAQEVELLLNNHSLGRQSSAVSPTSTRIAHAPFQFKLQAFAPGELRAIAFVDGTEVATHVVRTPLTRVGVETKLALGGIQPTRDDLVFVHARLIDANNTTVAVNDVALQLSIGDGLELVSPASVLTENGWAAYLVRVIDPDRDLAVSAK